ncbi:bile acid:sodium symporter [Metallumcola ferriviriculae]|uniref:Bile acid:sodium symporter n=1 Tax=Metallumcola ferriviriculae TaxID=3039180 RepID=A0AAU0ULM3_9FIRM|nr:bile acid:sodium symporter [Desulfitibacteraceae bacterium MK1]
MTIFKLIKDKLPYLIMGAIGLGLVNGYFNEVGYYKQFLTPVIFLMIYPMMINLKVTDVLSGFSTPRPLLYSVAINFIFSPLLAYVLSRLFFADYPTLTMGLMLIALVPTSGMTASWTGLANGNMKTALLIISVNLLLAIVMIPLYLKLLLGRVIPLDTMLVIKSLVQVVVVPLILGDLTRRLLTKKYGMKGFKAMKPQFAGISSTGVILIVFIATSLKSRTILGDGQMVLNVLVPLAIYYALILLASNLLGQKYLDYGDRVALIYGTTMRNLTIAMALTISSLEAGLAVFLIAVGYLLQVPFAALYMRYLNWRGSDALNVEHIS